MNKTKRLKSILRSVLTLAVAVALVANVNIMNPKAADVSVSISLSASSVSVGSGVTASISVSGSSISAYTMYVSYNSGVLQYNSGSGATINGGGGTVVVSGTSSGTVSLSFTAVANGSSSISTSGSDFLNIDGDTLSVSHAGVTVTVATAQSSSDSTSNGTSDTASNNNTSGTASNNTTGSTSTEASTTETTEEDTRSDNCNLSGLQISPGTLQPAFSSGTTYYEVQVDEDVTSMVVSATPEDSNATTQIWGAGLIEPGENTVKITVTAENGAVKVYNIRVFAGEDKGEANVTIDDEFYKFADNQSVDGIPDGFTDTTITYKDWEVLAFKSPNKKLTIVCLINVEEELKWFIYDEESDTFTPYQEYSSKYNRYIIMGIPEDCEYLDGSELVDVYIEANKVQALSSDALNDKNLYIVYAMNIEGDEAYYLYDKSEGTFMRYVAPAEKEEAAEATETDIATVTDVPDEGTGKPDKTDSLLGKLLVAATGLALVFFIAMLVMIAKLSELKKKITANSDDSTEENAKAPGKQASTFNLESLQGAEGSKSKSQGTIELPRTKKMDKNTSFVDAVNSEKPISFDGDVSELEASEAEKADSVDEIPSVDLDFGGDSLEIGYKPDEKEKNFERYADESDAINSRIMEGYNVDADSAFEETMPEEKDSKEDSGNLDSDKIDDSSK